MVAACQYRDMEGIEIRAATPDDTDVIADNHARCFAATYAAQLAAGELRAPDPDGTRQQFHEWFQPGSEFDTWVAVLDGVPIGHFTVTEHYLVHLFVHPDHHGRGLGTFMLAEGEATIARRGDTDMELHARVDNVGAIAFYEAKGWTVTDRLIHTVEHGISYDEHVLVKSCP